LREKVAREAGRMRGLSDVDDQAASASGLENPVDYAMWADIDLVIW
jgi:hypothetical protein